MNEVIAEELSARTKVSYEVVKDALLEQIGNSKKHVRFHGAFTVSLDFCRLFEDTLSDEEWRIYSKHLAVLTGAIDAASIVEHDKRLLQSTTHQRCIAFLKTIGKYKAIENKREEYFDHFLEVSPKRSRPSIATDHRLKKYRDAILADEVIWQDILDRHLGNTFSPDELRGKYPELYEHCLGNFWGMVASLLFDLVEKK
jgi:hypothetical protein